MISGFRKMFGLEEVFLNNKDIGGTKE